MGAIAQVVPEAQPCNSPLPLDLPLERAEGHGRPYSVRVDKGSTLILILGIRINYVDRPFGLSIVKGFPFVPPYTNDRHGILIFPICSVHCPGNDR